MILSSYNPEEAAVKAERKTALVLGNVVPPSMVGSKGLRHIDFHPGEQVSLQHSTSAPAMPRMACPGLLLSVL